MDYNSARLAVAFDLGTSGFRAQAIDLSSREIISTVILTQHPLPGGTVIDHVNYALEVGTETAGALIVRAMNRVIKGMGIPSDKVDRLAVCGNPTQLSLLQGIEIRDLAFTGKRKLAALGVTPPKRDARVMPARDIPELELPGACDVLIPPAIKHGVGADALAMIIQSKMLEREETSIATDFGTNAEVVLMHNGTVITGSTAAGPALEGRQISCGMLAVPGVISDLEPEASHYRLIVLDSEMLPVKGPLVDIGTNAVINDSSAQRPIGITGTGTIAIVNQGIESGLIELPHIKTADKQLHFGGNIFFTENDLLEAGKAFGAVRAGHITLCKRADIALGGVQTAYLAGASGTYMDAIKAQKLGLVPPNVDTVYQIGNSSLTMAKEIALDLKRLDSMVELNEKLRESYCMFAASKTFKQVYILEFSYWTEGMPMSQYRSFLCKYDVPDLTPIEKTPKVIHTVKRDIEDLGRLGLTTISDIG